MKGQSDAEGQVAMWLVRSTRRTDGTEDRPTWMERRMLDAEGRDRLNRSRSLHALIEGSEGSVLKRERRGRKTATRAGI
jgi:hypothetical protein